MTSTIKSDRKVVVATYTTEALFIIPDGLDLEDKTQVEKWYVRWNTLHITKTNGDTMEIELHEEYEDDRKRPQDVKIASAEEYGIEDDE